MATIKLSMHPKVSATTRVKLSDPRLNKVSGNVGKTNGDTISRSPDPPTASTTSTPSPAPVQVIGVKVGRISMLAGSSTTAGKKALVHPTLSCTRTS